ncbi:hypothetical protein P3T76_006160 [Phytophthora citrophthora]|uniref:RxLR effector protein n=1 Tax=Phytophthora citrophthora TaxID=4793 RepID=A0AAD9GR68_9STRA|nr:hypothetical protein P3T76_006160 [Phytophthora citrophthora]
MLFAYILLVAAAALLSSGNAQATGESRLLRSNKMTTDYSIEEERTLEGLEKAVIKNLPKQFTKMYHSSTKKNNTFASWYKGWKSVDEVTSYMKNQGLEFDTIAYFVQEYRKYITANGGRPY